MINLNKEYGVNISNYGSGKTQKIEVKVGRKTLYLDIDRCLNGTFVCVYNKNASSKYDADSDLHTAFVKNDSFLTKEFFESIAEIEKAQEIYGKFSKVLSK